MNSKQSIHILVEVDGELHRKKVGSIKEMSETFAQITKDHPKFNPTTDATVIVGECRCVRSRLIGATVRYELSDTGCEC